MYKDMTIIHGILECPLLNLGSKSEGRRAILTDDEGKKYKLYRAGILPAGDPLRWNAYRSFRERRGRNREFSSYIHFIG